MIRLLRCYPALLRAYFAHALVYRAELLIYLLSSTLPIMLMLVWVQLAGAGSIAGYTGRDFAGYYLAALLIRRTTAVWLAYDLDRQIRGGELSPFLLRPIDPVHYLAARTLTARALQLAMLIPLIGLTVLLVPGQQFDLSASSIFLVCLTCALGLAFEFLVQHTIGSLSFWLTQSTTLSDAWFFVKSMFGGFVAPLALFPAAMQAALRWLPFQIGLAIPIEILTGHATPERALQGVGVNLAWLLAIFALNRAVWRAGLRSYSAVGA